MRIKSLLIDSPPPISLRSEQNCLAVVCPVRGPVVPIVQGETSRSKLLVSGCEIGNVYAGRHAHPGRNEALAIGTRLRVHRREILPTADACRASGYPATGWLRSDCPEIRLG